MKKSLPYTCPRCGYSTILKGNIKTHFTRANICPSYIKDLDLTNEIKDYVLVNRVYNKDDKTSKKKDSITILNKDNYFHYVYLVRCKENVRHNENIYKIGKTILKELTINFKRMTGYGNGTELLIIRQCIDSSNTERQILEEFNKKFTKYDLGREYFIGDFNDMIDIINNIISQDYKKYKN